MSNLLKQNQLSEIKAQYGDFIIYNINPQREEKLKSILMENAKIVQEQGIDKIQGTIDIKITRELLVEFTNITKEELDNYNDATLGDLLSGGNSDLENVIFEITDIINKYTKKFYKELNYGLESTFSNLDMIETMGRVNEFKDKLGLSNEQFQNLLSGQLDLSKLEELAKQEKVAKKPTDHKKKRRTKAQIEADKLAKESKIDVVKESEKVVEDNGENIQA